MKEKLKAIMRVLFAESYIISYTYAKGTRVCVRMDIERQAALTTENYIIGKVEESVAMDNAVTVTQNIINSNEEG